MPNQEAHDSWIEYGKKASQKLDSSMASARQEKRTTWSQIILLSSAILGFSATFITLKFSIIPIIILIVAWGLFTLTLIFGVWLLIKDSNDYILTNTKTYFFTQDLVDIETKKVRGDITKEKYDELFVALTYLRSPDRSFFSEKVKKVFEDNKNELNSWKLIKNPKEYYFKENKWHDFKNKHITENKLFILFILSTVTLLIGLVISKFM